MTRLLCICVAGAVGTALRFGITLALPVTTRVAVPLATLVVNVLGSLLMGLVASLATEEASPTLRPILMTGLLGGFTTYSAYNQELLRMLEAKAWPMAATYAGITSVGCLVAGALGIALGRRLAG